MKRKIILTCIVIILTVINFILFKNFYYSNIEEKNIINVIDK